MSYLIRRVIVRGRVQGVGYRAWTEDQAILRGLAGYVRNRRDGAVEAVFAGPAEIVTAMVEACRQGPPAAAVTSVEERAGDHAVLKERPPGEEFAVLPTR